MKRRDFFKAIAAASAALAASRASTVIAAAKPLRPLPKCSIKADTQKMIADLLKASAAVSIIGRDYAFAKSHREVDVEYVYDEDGNYPVNLDSEVKRWVPDGSGIKNVTLTMCAPAHIIDLNSFHEPLKIVEPERRILVTYVVPT